MLILIGPGDPVFVSGMSGGPATVVKQNGSSVRVRMTSTGKPRTVDIDRLSVKPAPRALSVTTEFVPQVFTREAVLAAATDPIMLHERGVMGRLGLRHESPLRPVPKPVTLYSEPYLAFVREHPCCVCGTDQGVVPHHWSHHGAAKSKKCDDYRTVPLCDPCHMGEWHAHGTFPGMSREASEALMLRVQRELLLAWTATRLGDGGMVDALIGAIGGAHG